jgi:hypothetical protein
VVTGLAVGEVDRNGVGDAAAFADLGCQLVKVVAAARQQHDARALGRQDLSGRSADAARGASDEGDRTRDPHPPDPPAVRNSRRGQD